MGRCVLINRRQGGGHPGGRQQGLLLGMGVNTSNRFPPEESGPRSPLNQLVVFL